MQLNVFYFYLTFLNSGLKKRARDEEDDEEFSEEDGRSKRKRSAAESGSEEESEEDIDELVKDAKGFLRNKNFAKKM